MKFPRYTGEKRYIGEIFPIGSWVKCKNNDAIRFVTGHNGTRYFKDDGEISGLSPSPHCYYTNYELFIAI